jgi:hypothetical protein
VARTFVAVASGALAGLATGLIASTIGPSTGVYLGAIIVAGVAVTTVMVQPGGEDGTLRRTTAALLVTACLLAVAAPRPWVTGPAHDDGRPGSRRLTVPCSRTTVSVPAELERLPR